VNVDLTGEWDLTGEGGDLTGEGGGDLAGEWQMGKVGLGCCVVLAL